MRFFPSPMPQCNGGAIQLGWFAEVSMSVSLTRNRGGTSTVQKQSKPFMSTRLDVMWGELPKKPEKAGFWGIGHTPQVSHFAIL
jgi:hypothetical protein